MTPLDFARQPASKFETCAGFVIRWLAACGVGSRLPTTAEILQAWRENGVLGGAEQWFALIGLERCDPGPNCVVVIEQDGGGPLVGLTGSDGHFVTRAFGAVAMKTQPRIIAAWRIPVGARRV